MRTEIGLGSGATPDMFEAFKDVPMLDSADVSNAVIYVLGTKPHVQVMRRLRKNCICSESTLL